MTYYIEGHAAPTDAQWFYSNDDCLRNVYLVENGTVEIIQDEAADWPFTRKNRDADNIMLTKKFNCKFAHSFVITIDPLSYNQRFSSQIYILLTMFSLLIKSLIPVNVDITWLGVVEISTHRGVHMHLTGFFYKTFPKALIESILQAINKCQYVVKPIIDDGSSIISRFLATEQKIKSVASYLNYLKKDPKAIMGTNEEILHMFVNFDRTHIFSADSFPKRQKRSAEVDKINSNNELVIFLNTQMQCGKISLQDILCQPASQAYLHLSNLTSIYQNVYMQFVASCYHENNIIKIIEKFCAGKTNLGCSCPVLELLYRNKIAIPKFIQDLFVWLTGNTKQNTLTFSGPPNSGKSTIAKCLWELFPIHTRIVPDGLFSFANLINSGCGLWEEPFIDQTIIDTAKLILEGEPSVQIAIKNKPSQSLGKRVPIIVTTNRDLHFFVSSDKDALDVRMFNISMPVPFNTETVCKSTNHYCNNISGSASGTSFGFQTNTNAADNETAEVPTCTHNHKLLPEHVLTLVVYSLKINEHLIQSTFNKKPEEILSALSQVSISDFDYFLNTCENFPHNIDY